MIPLKILTVVALTCVYDYEILTHKIIYLFDFSPLPAAVTARFPCGDH